MTVSRGQGISPFECPNGHRSVEIGCERIWCDVCHEKGNTASWDKSELIDARETYEPRY
jgi:hypothetical protein